LTVPKTESGRRAAFAEVARRKSGKGAKLFGGMKTGELESYAKKPLDKGGSSSKPNPFAKKAGKKKKGKAPKFTAGDQAAALRG
jgi:hypothetical protein